MLNEDEKFILNVISQEKCEEEEIADFTKLEIYKVKTYIKSLKRQGFIRDGETFDEPCYMLTGEGEFALKDPDNFFQRQNITKQEILDILNQLKHNWKILKERHNKYKNSMKCLDELIKVIDENSIVIDWLRENIKEYDYKDKIESAFGSSFSGRLQEMWEETKNPKNRAKQLSFIYQLLKHALLKSQRADGSYYDTYGELSRKFTTPRFSSFSNNSVEEFNNIIENHFIVPLEDYLNSLMPDQQQQSNTPNTHIDTYTYIENAGIAHMSGGEIQSGAKVAAVINEAGQISQEQVLELLAQIEEIIKASNLPSEVVQEPIKFVGRAKEEAEEKELDKSVILKQLDRVINSLKKLDEGVDTVKDLGGKLAPLFLKLAPWLGVAAEHFHF